jgi:hypothetical protein
MKLGVILQYEYSFPVVLSGVCNAAAVREQTPGTASPEEGFFLIAALEIGAGAEIWQLFSPHSADSVNLILWYVGELSTYFQPAVGAVIQVDDADAVNLVPELKGGVHASNWR